MRGAFAAVVAAAVAVPALDACEPSIAPGAYLCGPEALCPEGQACDEPTNLCVLESEAQPFVCGKSPDSPGDDSVASAHDLGPMACASVVHEQKGCLPSGDPRDLYRFEVPATCSAVRLEASVSFPVAFQHVGFLFGDAGDPVAVDEPCPASTAAAAGEEVRCFGRSLAPGATYTLGVEKLGDEDCAGQCRFNRYVFRFRLATQ